MKSITINSLGEIFLNKNLVGGSVNLNTIGIPVKVITSSKKEDRAKMDKAVLEAIEKQVDDAFPWIDAFMVKSVLEKQSINNSRFRVYAVTKERRFITILVTEFVAFSDDSPAWTKIFKASRDLCARIEVMSEDKHLDKHKRDGEKHWNYGSNHGRMEKQIEFVWDVTSLTMRQINALVDRARKGTEEIWKAYGVDVM